MLDQQAHRPVLEPRRLAEQTAGQRGAGAHGDERRVGRHTLRHGVQGRGKPVLGIGGRHPQAPWPAVAGRTWPQRQRSSRQAHGAVAHHDGPAAQSLAGHLQGAGQRLCAEGSPPAIVNAGDERVVPEAQLGFGQAAGEEVVGELPGRQGVVGTAEVLPPRQARARRVLDLGHQRLPGRFVGGQGGVDVSAVFAERGHQRDRVLHRHLGARADREVGGVRGVAEQRDRGAPDPVPPAAGAPGPEVTPPGVVDEQRMPVGLLGEEILQVGLALLVARAGRLGDVELVQAGCSPGRLVGLDDEGGDAIADGVSVHGEGPVRAALVHEGQAGELIGRTQPDELGRRGLGAGRQDVREPLAQPRVGAVGGDD